MKKYYTTLSETVAKSNKQNVERGKNMQEHMQDHPLSCLGAGTSI